MLLEPRPYRLRLLACFLREIGGGIRRRRRRGRAQQLIEHPCSPQHRRRAVGVGSPHQHGGLAQQAEAFLIGEGDPAELRARDARDSVMPSQAFVQERVVGGEEIHDAAVLQEDAADESFRLGGKITPQLIVESREQHGVGLHGLQAVEIQPLHRKVGDQTGGLGIRQHAPHLFLHRARFGQAARLRESQQFLVGAGVPEEERETRGQFKIGESELRVAPTSGTELPKSPDRGNSGWPVPPPRLARFPDRRFLRLSARLHRTA